MAAPRVLVIDDDPTFRNIVATVLRQSYLVSVAGSGAEGLDKAQEFIPDVVVLDVQMPGLDGVQTLAAFRAHPALSHVPVMMLTADSTKTTVLGALQAGANDYLLKMTMRKEELLAKVHRLLAQRRLPLGGSAGSKVAGRPSPDSSPPPSAATSPTVPPPKTAPATLAPARDRSPGRPRPLVAEPDSARPSAETPPAENPRAATATATATAAAVETPPSRTADLQTVLDNWE